MSNYTLEYLQSAGQKYVLAALIKCRTIGEPFVTYGQIKAILQTNLNIKEIFTPKTGGVVGAMMDSILEYDPDAPLINALVTRSDGIPGKGVGSFIEKRYKKETVGDWLLLPKKQKILLVEKIRQNVRQYTHWEDIYSELYGDDLAKTLPETTSTEQDGDPGSSGQFGGGGESEDHKKLKDWVLQNPKLIGIPSSFDLAEIEYPLPSGDLVDVMFSDGINFIPVEVKSWRSSYDDMRRGIYQCVKYREVSKAKELPALVTANPILITEEKMPKLLRDRADLLKVRCQHVNVGLKEKQSK